MKVSRMPGYQSPWLRAEDLQGHTVTVTVASVTAQTMRSFEGVDEERLVVGFENKAKKLPLNRSQASVFVRLFGDDTETWLGKQVQLSPAESRQPGKLTIAVTGVATAEGGALPF